MRTVYVIDGDNFFTGETVEVQKGEPKEDNHISTPIPVALPEDSGKTPRWVHYWMYQYKPTEPFQRSNLRNFLP